MPLFCIAKNHEDVAVKTEPCCFAPVVTPFWHFRNSHIVGTLLSTHNLLYNTKKATAIYLHVLQLLCTNYHTVATNVFSASGIAYIYTDD